MPPTFKVECTTCKYARYSTGTSSIKCQHCNFNFRKVAPAQMGPRKARTVDEAMEATTKPPNYSNGGLKHREWKKENGMPAIAKNKILW